MASGHGVFGTVGRCYSFFHDFEHCMKTQSDPASKKSQCVVLRDDYLECLHNRKEYERHKEIRREKKKLLNSTKESGDAHGSGPHH
eukprot:gene31261-40630_t